MSYWFVGIGGFAGALLHAGMRQLIAVPEGVFPVGTLLMNCTGSFILLFLIAATELFGNKYSSIRLLLGTGAMGAYTTFSGLSAETFALFMDGEWRTALLYISSTVVGGLFAALVGWRVGLALANRLTRESLSK